MDHPEINSISQYNSYIGKKTLHPLISVVDFSTVEPFEYKKGLMKVYAIFIKEAKCGDIVYGCNHYDYEEGSMLFVAPDQIYGVESHGEKRQASGHAIIFHPDLLKGTALENSINDYSFFSYAENEALHLSSRERLFIDDTISKIQSELEQSIDKHSNKLIVSNLELLLNYCTRYYDRQFLTRQHVNKELFSRFDYLLNQYLNSDKPSEIGFPSVSYFANELCLSPNYFGDLIKKETGKSAQEQIHQKVIEIAKGKIFEFDKSISDVAYELGFNYPQHFTRMFKRITGYSPNEYKSFN